MTSSIISPMNNLRGLQGKLQLAKKNMELQMEISGIQISRILPTECFWAYDTSDCCRDFSPSDCCRDFSSSWR